MSRTATAATNTGTTSAGRDWKMDVSVGERRPLWPQVLFLYAMGTAIGLYIALIHLYFFRSAGAFFFFFAAALVFTTGTLVLWQALLPRLSELPLGSRLAWQVVISIASFLALTYLTSE